jgi:hypothetical protein
MRLTEVARIKSADPKGEMLPFSMNLANFFSSRALTSYFSVRSLESTYAIKLISAWLLREQAHL